MDIQTAIMQRRTIRRYQNKPVSADAVRKLVELSRLYASGGNLQPIRYVGIVTQPLLDDVFATLKWAAYLPGYEIREENRPAAYVVLTCDANAKRNCQFDVGAAATTLMLAAEGEGLATCCLGSFNAKVLKELLDLPENTEPALVISLGYPAHQSRAVDLVDDVKYYEDSNGCLCVPKRTLEEVLQLR